MASLIALIDKFIGQNTSAVMALLWLVAWFLRDPNNVIEGLLSVMLFNIWLAAACLKREIKKLNG